MMIPFCWSGGGGAQEILAEREDDGVATKVNGLALGTAKDTTLLI